MSKDSFEISDDLDLKVIRAHILESAQRSMDSEIEGWVPEMSVEDVRQNIQRSNIFINAIDQVTNKYGNGFKGWLEFKVKKFLKWLVHWNAAGQVDFNHSVKYSLELITDYLQDAERNLVETSKDTQRNRLEISSLEQTVNQKIDEIKVMMLKLESSLKRERAATETLQSTSNFNERIAERLPQSSEQQIIRSAESSMIIPSSTDKFIDQQFNYFEFENKFRGSIDEIKRRHSKYLELFLDKKNVLDLGCGRGEFVELLSERGVYVTGVDSNEVMVDFCRDRGLRVMFANFFSFLAGLPDSSLDGIFTAQVVEHFPFEKILELINLCMQKLKPKGVIVVETININCPIAFANFYLDPTHVRPLPPLLLQYMFEQCQFKVQSMKFSSPISSTLPEILDVSSESYQDVTLYQDYAVVAIK
jgi:2-polyprenyl-3-methyl-5-hydroxy-6-metoxy-1,4-benzoquinol methylase